MQPHILLLHLLQVKHHINDIAHAFRLPECCLQQAITAIRRLRLLKHAFQRGKHQCQWRTQLMAHMDQEIHLFLVHELPLFGQLSLQAPLLPNPHIRQDSHYQQHAR